MKQVNDFCVSCEDQETAKGVIHAINAKMTIDIKELCLISCFNENGYRANSTLYQAPKRTVYQQDHEEPSMASR